MHYHRDAKGKPMDARPYVADGEGTTICIRMSLSERKDLEQLAKREGKALSTYCRDVVLERSKK